MSTKQFDSSSIRYALDDPGDIPYFPCIIYVDDRPQIKYPEQFSCIMLFVDGCIWKAKAILLF